jgi:hypothetical protein
MSPATLSHQLATTTASIIDLQRLPVSLPVLLFFPLFPLAPMVYLAGADASPAAVKEFANVLASRGSWRTLNVS